jgi:hypothetical protein
MFRTLRQMLCFIHFQMGNGTNLSHLIAVSYLKICLMPGRINRLPPKYSNHITIACIQYYTPRK